MKDELAGKKTSCKACREILQIPKPPKSVAAKRKPAEPEEDDWDEAVLDQEIDPPSQSKRSKPVHDTPLKKSKGKGKKRGAGQSSGMPKGLAIALIVGSVVIGLGGIGFLAMKLMGRGGGDGGGAGVAEAKPAEGALPKMQEVRNELGNFAIDFPDGWTAKHGGGSGGMPPFASTTNGNIYLSVKSDPHASALFATNQNATESEMRLEDHPVHRAHELIKIKLEGEYNSFEETEPKLITTKFGDGRISEFVAKEGIFSTTKGLRATFLSGTYSLKIICKCPQGEYAENEPLFREVIQSFRQ